jgi:hypothetical protein
MYILVAINHNSKWVELCVVCDCDIANVVEFFKLDIRYVGKSYLGDEQKGTRKLKLMHFAKAMGMNTTSQHCNGHNIMLWLKMYQDFKG